MTIIILIIDTITNEPVELQLFAHQHTTNTQVCVAR